jgi:hypothetical protein
LATSSRPWVGWLDALDELKELAREERQRNPKLSHTQSVTKVYTDPANVELVKRERRPTTSVTSSCVAGNGWRFQPTVFRRDRPSGEQRAASRDESKSRCGWSGGVPLGAVCTSRTASPSSISGLVQVHISWALFRFCSF